MTKKLFRRSPKLTVQDNVKPQAVQRHPGPGQTLLPVGWPDGLGAGNLTPYISGRPQACGIADPRRSFK